MFGVWLSALTRGKHPAASEMTDEMHDLVGRTDNANANMVADVM